MSVVRLLRLVRRKSACSWLKNNRSRKGVVALLVSRCECRIGTPFNSDEVPLFRPPNALGAR
jgi:hypothetical protein